MGIVPVPGGPSAAGRRSTSPSRTIVRLVAEPDGDDDSGGDTPIREPYVGTCDCPYDQMRNGRSCRGRSAYSKPGGRKPKCYR